MKKAIGWAGVSVSILFSCIWIYWGVFEKTKSISQDSTGFRAVKNVE